MCEVNSHNFQHLYPEIKKALQDAKFFSIDLEFSALYPLIEHSPSIVDTPSERYAKLRANLEIVIPLQVGLTAFSFDSDRNSYCGKVYTFFVQPACFQGIHKNFCFQSSTLNFLKVYKFDFNKFVYDGIPFMNKNQEEEVRQKMSSDSLTEFDLSCKLEFYRIIERDSKIIKSWYDKAKLGDFLTLPEICTKKQNNEETIYFVHKEFRRRFENLWTYIENEEFTVKKVTKKEFSTLKNTYSLDEQTIQNLLGFSKIFKLLTSLKKPIVGHNIYQDLLLMIGSFETNLPESYSGFKKLTNELFPTVFDTKNISYNLRDIVPKEKAWDDRGLDTIFDYFKNGIGRTLASNAPAIEMEEKEDSFGKFHHAGWDSFCTGYIFIRLAHLNIYQKYPLSKRFVSSEHIAALSPFKNKVNIIRGSVSHINLDGADPSSTRPPYLVIESLKNKPVCIPQVASLLSTFGYTEVRKIPYQNKRALIAVDNYGNARRILRDFKNLNTEYNVQKYNSLKHSPFAKIFLVSGLTVSSVLILWLTHSVIKR